MDLSIFPIGSLIPEKGDDVDKFEKEPHLYSDEGLDKFKSVEEFLKKYRENNKDA